MSKYMDYNNRRPEDLAEQSTPREAIQFLRENDNALLSRYLPGTFDFIMTHWTGTALSREDDLVYITDMHSLVNLALARARLTNRPDVFQTYIGRWNGFSDLLEVKRLALNCRNRKDIKLTKHLELIDFIKVKEKSVPELCSLLETTEGKIRQIVGILEERLIVRVKNDIVYIRSAVE